MVESIIPAWLTSLFESFGPQAVGGSEAVIGGGAAPMSFGDTLAGVAKNEVSQQIAPVMDMYKTMTNPSSTMGDMARPMSFGDTLGEFAKNEVRQQIAPAMGVYNTMTNPYSTMGDMANSAFKYSFNPKEDEKALMMPQMGGGYGGGMASNYVGGIPSILQKTNSGILPYIGSR